MVAEEKDTTLEEFEGSLFIEEILKNLLNKIVEDFDKMATGVKISKMPPKKSGKSILCHNFLPGQDIS